MEKSLDVTDNIVTSLKVECAKAGTSLYKVCKATGVSQTVLWRWEKEEPKSIRTLRKLQAEIARQAQERAKGKD